MLERPQGPYAELADAPTERLGVMVNYAWQNDPKRLAFTAARYLFVARAFAGRQKVLEIGCADAFFSRIVAQHIGDLVVSDRDHSFIADVNDRMDERWPMTSVCHDMLDGAIDFRSFDAIYALDVLEHIDQKDEVRFLRNAVTSLRDHGIAIFGMPSIESQHLASPLSRAGHVNCKSAAELRATMLGFFHAVFIVGMNDSAIHGDLDMAHYLMAVCADPRTC